ncbi:hypothetical protein [Halohasta salina]|uniref:hypothetical protein n=1 Tax=Halohasta salina TaxID=2961621 RepID=UPI0020A34508|nr:hypothetical protein [Halohasta salina]
MRIRQVATLFLVASMVLTAAVGPVAAQQQTTQINPDASAAQNPYISADVTVDAFDRSAMEPGQYEDDSGEIATLPAVVDKSDDVDDLGTGEVNPYHFVASDIEFADAAGFPNSEGNVSAVHNESRWSTDTSASAGSMTVADSSTAPGVESLEVSTSSQSSGDTAVASFSDVSIDSDVEKRYLQAIADVSADSGATVEIRAVDADGDYVAILNGTTGEGVVDQEQIGKLSVSGSGDGSMSEVQSIEVVISDGDATVDVSALNADKSSEWTLGDERIQNPDNSDEFDTETVTDHDGGQIQIHDMSTLGPAFEDATISDLTIPMDFRAADLEADANEVNVTFSEAPEYPSFDQKQTARYRIELPDAYDLSYANAELRQESNIPNSRYQSVDILEGASDTNFSDLSGWVDVLDQIGSSGEDVVLDDTIQPGQEIAYKSVTLVTGDEASEVQNVAEGIVGMTGSSGGVFGAISGFFGTIWGKITGAATVVLGGSRLFGGD